MKPRGLNSIPIFKINEGSKGFYELGDQRSHSKRISIYIALSNTLSKNLALIKTDWL